MATSLTSRHLQGFDCATITEIPVIECQALVAFHESTSPWIDQGGWLSNNSPCTSWEGIVCNSAGHVGKLFMNENGLSGSLVSELGDLEMLTWLQLNGNEIGGQIPSTIGKLQQVKWLRLEKNKLIGDIPSEIGSMSSLQYLYLSGNTITSTLPTELAALSDLVRLYVSDNQLTGFIPSEIGSCEKLQGITLGRNGFLGSFPNTFVNLSSMTYLHFLNSGVCIPDDASFARWLAEIDGVYGPLCDTKTVKPRGRGRRHRPSLLNASPTPMPIIENTPMPITENPPMPITENTPMPITENTPMPITENTSMPQARPTTTEAPNLNPGPTGQNMNLCQGLVMDRNLRRMEPLDKPGFLQTVLDPAFGTLIRRITDIEALGVTGDQAVLKPMYNTIQSWNADETLLILYQRSRGHMLLNGFTYAFIQYLDIFPADLEEVFWSFSDPDVLYYAEPYYLNEEEPGQRLVRYSISAGTVTEIRSFAAVCNADGLRGGNDVQMMSWDSDTIGFRCTSNPGRFFGYKISFDSITPVITSGINNNFLPWVAPQSTPSGRLYFLRDTVLDENMNIIRTLNLASPEHACLGRFRDGTDGLFTVAFQQGPRGGCDGVLVAHNLADGTCRTLVGQGNGYPYPPSGIHMSALSHLNPGWIAVSIIGVANRGVTGNAGQDLLDSELLLVNSAEGGDICRIGHHRSWGRGGRNGYWAEPHVVISPSGTRILFGSDWEGGGSVDSYVVELPTYAGPDGVR